MDSASLSAVALRKLRARRENHNVDSRYDGNYNVNSRDDSIYNVDARHEAVVILIEIG